VRFVLPSGWKVVSALKETDDPFIFSAPDYDVLVDAPTEMGTFDVRRFEVEGKAHYFVANPAGAFSSEKSQKFTEMLAKVAKAESAIFNGLPYEKYVYFYFFAPPESNASGALEHLNSHVSFGPPGNFAEPQQLIGTAAHEYFHLWNVKRIRPVEMWPYDYTRENETPLLWVSEGFTSYYGAVATYRAGLSSTQDFLQHVADAAAGVENNEARGYISPAEASVSTWLGYDTPVVFGISYYTQGMNIAALMDLSIRHDTNGRAGLDDLMRALYEECYKRGKGFSADDMIRIINRLTGRDYHDFFRRYVTGVEVPPYETFFAYAGYRVEKTSRQNAWVGFDARNRRGTLVVSSTTPNSPAAKAGIQAGDTILKVNGAEPFRVNPNDLAGKTAKLTISRDGEEKEISVNVLAHTETSYRLTEAPQPTPEQLRVRQAWLKP
jgi:predicted metalloprotease with PDZ domain